jgi:hypothetical protein
MCDKCAQLDKKIDHCGRMLVSIGDRVTVERLEALIADLQTQKAAIHSEIRVRPRECSFSGSDL